MSKINFKNKLKEFYDASDDYLRMLDSQAEDIFSPYAKFINYWLTNKGTLLDLGCGTGISSHLLARRGYDVTGIDFSSSFIRTAMRYRKTQGNLKYLVADIIKLPFRDNSFEAVTSYNVIEHLYDIPQALNEMLRVIKREGFIFIYAPSLLSPRLPLNVFLRGGGYPEGNGYYSKLKLLYLILRNLSMLLKKELSSKAHFNYKEPNLEKMCCDGIVHADLDAPYLSNPLDIKKFFLNNACEILDYQTFRSCKYLWKNKGLLSKILYKLFPSGAGIIRIVIRKKSS